MTSSTLKETRSSRISDLQPMVFVAFWTGLNLLQAALTDVHNDESYYWVYTQHLQWGYYDHPPMVALWIKAGMSLFSGPFGLRLINVLGWSGSLVLWLDLLDRRFRGEFYLLLLGAPFLNYLSFMVFPDGPLVFFTSLFLWSYFRYEATKSPLWLLLMTGSLAAMLYSKYHAVLVLPLLMLGHPALFRKAWPYLVGSGACVVFLPHLWWQYENGFPTFQFHTTGRMEPFSWEHPAAFVLGQFLALGTVLIFALLAPIEGSRDRFLKRLVVGIYLFFLLASLRGVVHLQWTSIAYFPAIVLASRYLHNKQTKILHFIVVIFCFLTLALRLVLMIPILPGGKIGPHYVHGQRTWAEGLADQLGDKTLVFEYDLKEPSVYAFYTGKEALAFFPGYRKKSQYDLWRLEDDLQGKQVVVARKYGFPGSRGYALGRHKIYLQEVEDFRSFQNIRITINEVVSRETGTRLSFTIVNHRSEPITLAQPVEFFLRSTDRSQKDEPLSAVTVTIGPGSSEVVLVDLPRVSPGTFRIGMRGGPLSASLNSDPFIISK